MPDQPAPEIELLRAAYAAFNARDIDAALALMTPDVAWPKAFKGGSALGHEGVRAYWLVIARRSLSPVATVSFYKQIA
jgi:ketosteroid isomerase-like protein